MEKELLSEQESLLQSKKKKYFGSKKKKLAGFILVTKIPSFSIPLRRRRKAIYMIKDQFGNQLKERGNVIFVK